MKNLQKNTKMANNGNLAKNGNSTEWLANFTNGLYNNNIQVFDVNRKTELAKNGNLAKNSFTLKKLLETVENGKKSGDYNIKEFDAFITGEKTKKYYTDDIITEDNLIQMASAITVKAIQVVYKESGLKYINKILLDAIGYARALSDAIEFHNSQVLVNCPKFDGADLIQDTILYLSNYIGCNLKDLLNKDGVVVAVDKTHPDGTKDYITIIIKSFRNIHNIIYKYKQREYKQTYIEDYENNRLIAVSANFGDTDFDSYKKAIDIIKSLKLTTIQKQVLNLRLEGYSLVDIATIRKVAKGTIITCLRDIQRKYINIYGELPKYICDNIDKAFIYTIPLATASND